MTVENSREHRNWKELASLLCIFYNNNNSFSNPFSLHIHDNWALGHCGTKHFINNNVNHDIERI